jgi:hypothetical protein
MLKKWANSRKSKSVLVEPPNIPDDIKTRERSISLPIPVICDIEGEPTGRRDTLKQFRTFVKNGVGVDTPRVKVTKTSNGRRHSFTYDVDDDIIMTFHISDTDEKN